MDDKENRKEIGRILQEHLLKRGLSESEIKRILGERRKTSNQEKLNLIIKA